MSGREGVLHRLRVVRCTSMCAAPRSGSFTAARNLHGRLSPMQISVLKGHHSCATVHGGPWSRDFRGLSRKPGSAAWFLRRLEKDPGASLSSPRFAFLFYPPPQVSFLRYIRQWGKKVVFALNKVDALADEGEVRGSPDVGERVIAAPHRLPCELHTLKPTP